MKSPANKLTKKEVIEQCESVAYNNEIILSAKYKRAKNGKKNGKYWYVEVKCKDCGKIHEEPKASFINRRKNKRRKKCSCQVNKNQIELLNKKSESENVKMNNVVVLSGKLADVQYLNNDMIKFNLDSGQGIFECMRIFKTEKEYEEFRENYSENMSLSVFGYPKRNTIFPMYVVCAKPLKYNGKYSITDNTNDKFDKKLKDKDKQVKEFENNYREVLKEKLAITTKNVALQKENQELNEKIEKLKHEIEELKQEEDITLKEIKEALSIKKTVEKINKRFDEERKKSIEEKFIEDVKYEIFNNRIEYYGAEVKLENTRLGQRIYYNGEKIYAYDLFNLAKEKGIVKGENGFNRILSKS